MQQREEQSSRMLAKYEHNLFRCNEVKLKDGSFRFHTPQTDRQTMEERTEHAGGKCTYKQDMNVLINVNQTQRVHLLPAGCGTYHRPDSETTPMQCSWLFCCLVYGLMFSENHHWRAPTNPLTHQSRVIKSFAILPLLANLFTPGSPRAIGGLA